MSESYEELKLRCERLERDNERMQERITWLESTVDDNNKYLDDLMLRIDKVGRQIKYLASMQEQPDAVRPLSEETPPPHY